MSIMRSNMARQLYNTGGITNLINTYMSNPTLQSQMTQQEYLNLFNPQTTQTSPTVEKIIQSSISPTIQTPTIKPILPIIPQESGSDGINNIMRSTKQEKPLTFRESMAKLNLEMGVPTPKEEEEKFGLKSLLEKLPTMKFLKGAKDKTQKIIEDYFARKAEEERIRQEQLANAAELARRGTGAYITQDSFGNDYGQRAGGGSFSGRGPSTDITATEGSS